MYICSIKANNMKIQTTLQGTRVMITEASVADFYFIEQADDNKFYITSNNGYNGHEGDGFAELEKAIKQVKNFIKNYYNDRGQENPKGW